MKPKQFLSKIKLFFAFSFLLSNLNVNAQLEKDTLLNTFYGGIGHQNLLFLKCETLLWHNNWTQTIVNIGIGANPGFHETKQSEQDGKFSIIPEIGQLIGYKILFIEAGVEPAFNFSSKYTSTDINAILGLRYQRRDFYSVHLFLEIGWCPIIYRTHKNDTANGYLGGGITF